MTELSKYKSITDSELLNLAACAAGYKVSNRLVGGGLMVMSKERKSPHKWDPIDNDGDALRLAVRLGIWSLTYSDDLWLRCNKDGYAATRMSIVMSAAIAGDKK